MGNVIGLMILAWGFAMGIIVGYGYRPKPKPVDDPLNQMNSELSEEIKIWKGINWIGGNGEWTVRGDLMRPMLDALGIKYEGR